MEDQKSGERRSDDGPPGSGVTKDGLNDVAGVMTTRGTETGKLDKKCVVDHTGIVCFDLVQGGRVWKRVEGSQFQDYYRLSRVVLGQEQRGRGTVWRRVYEGGLRSV